MLYIFLDETYSSDQSLRFASVAVPQSHFSSGWADVSRIASQGARKRRELLLRFLANGGYRVVTTDLNVPKAQAALSELWPGPDPDGVSSRDDLWLQAFGYSVAYSVRCASRVWAFETVDVFHDPKSLQDAHKEAYESKLREVVNRLSSREVAENRRALRGRVKVRRVEAVPKPQPQRAYTKLQEGTWLAHWLTKIPAEDLREELNERFYHYDLTRVVMGAVEETLQERKAQARGDQKNA